MPRKITRQLVKPYVPSRDVLRAFMEMRIKYHSLHLSTIMLKRKDLKPEQESNSLTTIIDGTIRKLAEKNIIVELGEAYDKDYLFCDARGNYPTEVEDKLRVQIAGEFQRELIPLIGPDLVRYVRKNQPLRVEGAYTLTQDRRGVHYRINPDFKTPV